jgi:cupin fold WbuC family metalloprotein
MPETYRHTGNTVQILSRDLLEKVLEQARQSPRRRMNFNFHGSMEDNPHRFLNVMLRGTYVRPHRHTDPPKAEAFVILEGQVAFILFDEEGKPVRYEVLGPGEGSTGVGVDVPPGHWHTLTPITEHAICYEVKPGPFSPVTDKEFAPWAPMEGDPSVPEYLKGLLAPLERR